jgi:hypothetical protein
VALGNSTRLAAHAVNAGALWALACGQPATAFDCAVLLPQAARRIPVLLRVGNADPLEPYVTGDAGRFTNAGWLPGQEIAIEYFAGGHSAGAADLEAAWSWFEGRALPP